MVPRPFGGFFLMLVLVHRVSGPGFIISEKIWTAVVKSLICPQNSVKFKCQIQEEYKSQPWEVLVFWNRGPQQGCWKLGGTDNFQAEAFVCWPLFTWPLCTWSPLNGLLQRYGRWYAEAAPNLACCCNFQKAISSQIFSTGGSRGFISR